VSRMISEAVAEEYEKGANVYKLLDTACAEGARALAKTPDLLPVLKEAGVVDSGGQGLVQIMKGCFNGFLGIEEEEEEEEAAAPVKQYAYRTEFILKNREHISKEEQVSIEAGKIVGKMYDALVKQYGDNSPKAARWLNILCVRLVFCLYAEDAGLFTHDQFHDFLARYDVDDLRRALRDLFEVLNTPIEKRSKYLKDDLKAFPYTNGGLFEEDIEIPQFTEELKQILLQDASLDFDWSDISPTIFGSLFESTLNPDTRRSGGMHYTSIENIHKVIDPLFLNDLRSELDKILEEKVERQRKKKLEAYQDKLASLTFLDPACGSGNFLTETYLSLRRLENEAIREITHGQTQFAWEGLSPVKVSIHQFYGIEINDFAVEVAKTALWISEAQMLAETERIIHHEVEFLPLKSYANIREGNALKMDWSEWEVKDNTPAIIARHTSVYPIIEDEEPTMVGEPIVEYENLDVYSKKVEVYTTPKMPQTRSVHFDYIMGNPPFVGSAMMSAEQKRDAVSIFGRIKLSNSIDYVGAWYFKVAQFMGDNPRTKAALVSTNSICQGEQAAALWEPLHKRYGINIQFAYRTFRWDSEATSVAHVHCIIIGFMKGNTDNKVIFDGEQITHASNINAYLIDAPDVFIESRSTPICDVPKMTKGNQPSDGGNLILSEEERARFIQNDPTIASCIRRYVGAKDYLNNNEIRYCLWLRNIPFDVYSQNRDIYERLRRVKEMRAVSSAAPTRAAADKPHLFFSMPQTEESYLVVPRVSSERRKYIPVGFMTPDIIAADSLSIVPGATLYHFGVLISFVHMAWMRVVAGRLKSDYRYSGSIVYNTFPWPTPTEEQRHRIEQTAQAILDARAACPNSSLAKLYDDVLMPVELRKAHQDNDHAVMQAYGFPAKSDFTESQCVAELFRMYQKLTKQ
ncbi:MAG: DAK2 domain-containing protein, partial [Bacteroidaceae bacterium]|nr:DAK2 domain-containing protein [Bacteroidaceae bacterium]